MGDEQMIEVNVDVKPLYPSDDFYLQWKHIFWWQFQFNLDYAVREIMNDLDENCR